MIRKLLFTWGLLAILSACSSDNLPILNDTATITFATSTDVFATIRSAETKLTTIQTDANGFGVLAYHAPVNWASNGTSLTANIMNGSQIKYAATRKSWRYSPAKYWPLTGTTSFFAYYPYHLITNYSDTQTGIPCFNYTIADEVANQADILAACQIDATSQTVKFTFKHLLSKIGFSIKKAYNYTDTIIVTKLTLNYINIKKEGTFTYGTNSASVGTWTVGNTLHDSNVKNVLYNTNTTLTATTPIQINDADKYLYLLPQALAQGNLTLTVNYSVAGVAREKTVELFPSETTFELEQGKQYNIILTIALDGVLQDEIIVGDYTEENPLVYQKAVYKSRVAPGDTDAAFEAMHVDYYYLPYPETIVLRDELDLIPYLSEKEFLGWSTLPASTTPEYLAGQHIALTPNLTLYAVWEDAMKIGPFGELNINTGARKFLEVDREQGIGDLNTYKWDRAKQICSGRGGSWRVPTQNELHAIWVAQEGLHRYKLNTNNSNEYYYWSSSLSTTVPITISFYDGAYRTANTNADTRPFRCVRDLDEEKLVVITTTNGTTIIDNRDLPSGARTETPKVRTTGATNYTKSTESISDLASAVSNQTVSHYFEIAPTDLVHTDGYNTISWGDAFNACINYSIGDGNDTWRLPTQRELILIWIHTGTSILGAVSYWAATDNNATSAWVTDLYSKFATTLPKEYRYRARCIRDITPLTN